jgi:N,N-dimethylformamidase
MIHQPAELPVTGYLDRLAHRPGERFRAHVSVRDGGRYRIRLVRVISGDPNPAGPGLKFEDLSGRLDLECSGRRFPVSIGSWAEAPAPAWSGGSRTWTALVWLGHDARKRQAALSQEDSAGARLSVLIGADGAEALLGDLRVSVDAAIQPLCWYRVWATIDSMRLTVGFCDLHGKSARAHVPRSASDAKRIADGVILIAARGASSPADHFDGRIEDCAIINSVREEWHNPLERLGEIAELAAGWDFSRGIDTQTFPNVLPDFGEGRLINAPMRAVRGARWTGEELCWRHAPGEYGAIHFHSDDLHDCGWPVAFQYDVPADLASGAYAFHLQCDGGQDWLPFYVLAPRHGARPSVAFLASTYTYQAYGNDARRVLDPAFRQRIADWGAYPYAPEEHPVYGRSTYNRHPDGSGIAYSSRLRPLLTMRPGYIYYNDAKGSGLRHYPADTHLLAWLEAQGIAYDVITDEDLEDEGVSCLERYRMLLTGSHPEYHTAATWDALHAFTRGGGRLAYLGGNGFYWRIARNPAVPGLIEMRRSEDGTRAWASEPGEYYNALDGCYSGLWRRNGRDPQQLVGVGFTSQGAYEATYFRRTQESYAAELAWMFEGIEGGILGDYGLSAGGAAGFEYDRADVRLGTPRQAVIVARSENHPQSFYPVMEELLTPVLALDLSQAKELVHADMVYFDLPGGGAIFSVGSITFCGSLWKGGFQGPVSRLLRNVVDRFTGGG